MFGFCFLLYLLFLFTQSLTKDLLLDNMKLFITVIYPSLFTSLVLISLAKNSKIIWFISYRLFPLFHAIFHLKYQKSVEIILISVFCGCPGNASLLSDAIENKVLDFEEANQVISSTSTMSLSYCITILSLFFTDTWLLILLSYFLGHFIFLWLKGLGYNNERNKIKRDYSLPKDNFEFSFLASIQTSTNILLNIFGIMIFFTSISAILLHLNPNYKYFAFLIEICSGLTLIPKNPLLVLTALCLLGASMTLQIKKSFPNLSLQNFLKDKICIVTLSNIIFLVIKDVNLKINVSYFYLIPIILLVFIFILLLVIHPKH